MVIVRFRDKEEHTDVMKKVKKMKKFIEEIEDMFEECYDDEDADYRDEYEDDMRHEREMRVNGRYGYRRGGGSRGRM